MKSIKNVRLPEHVIPKRYSITLFPNLQEFTFSGEEEITLELREPAKEIILHAAELEITSAEIISDKKKLKAAKITYDEKFTLDTGCNVIVSWSRLWFR